MKQLLEDLIERINQKINDKYSNNVYFSFENGELIKSWETGRNEGGNCWGGEASYQSSDINEPEFQSLVCFILSLNPKFPLKEYMELQTKIKQGKTYSSDYYGNGVYYAKRSISLDDIFDSFNTTQTIIQEDTILDAFDYFERELLPKTNPPTKNLRFN